MGINTIIKLTEAGDGHDITCSIRSDGQQISEIYGYITGIRFTINNQIVALFDTGKNISENPLFGIHLSSIKVGDRVSAIWISANGAKGQASIMVG